MTGSHEHTSTEKSIFKRLWRGLVGSPRDLADKSLFHRLSLIPFLAWVGLGADGLSSSAYGPEEAFRQLAGHPALALVLAAMVAGTVALISLAYSRIIEAFPSGGGGYFVASKLLGPRVGVVSGAALVVDYVLTITISIAAAGDALFSFLPPHWAVAKLPAETGMILVLAVLNLRGIRESVLALTPIFVAFVLTHILAIGYGFVAHVGMPDSALAAAPAQIAGSVNTLGLLGVLGLLLHAYSMGGGTYTGIEAVSNGLPIMQEPRAATAKRTMLYMATSLALTAAGLLVCYMLWSVEPQAGKTMNAVLMEVLAQDAGLGRWAVILTLFTEAALLVVAAQAGFLDGPRVLSNMATDSWMPHRFAALSEQLTVQNGILVMAGAALAALWYTGGSVGHIVVMYSINVFLTFSLSMLGMLRRSVTERYRERRRDQVLFGLGLAVCMGILVLTVVEKFAQGGWITVLITGALVCMSFMIRRHYATLSERTQQLFRDLRPAAALPLAPRALDPRAPTAVLFVGAFGGLGMHTILRIQSMFPGFYRNVVFASVGVVDSGGFKGEGAIEELSQSVEQALDQYVQYAQSLGLAATRRYAVGVDAVDKAEELAASIAQEFPANTFFAGKLVFRRDSWWMRLLHNGTATAIQRRLELRGMAVVVVPARV